MQHAKSKQRPGAIVVALLACGVPHAMAATDTTTFAASATVLSDCNLTASDMAFGNYDATAGALDASSAIAVYCTLGTNYTISLNVGTGGGTYVGRTLNNGANTLNFNLYTNAARTTVWGDGTAATSTVAGTGGGLLTAANHTVYGRVTAGQERPLGLYSSTIVVTVTF